MDVVLQRVGRLGLGVAAGGFIAQSCLFSGAAALHSATQTERGDPAHWPGATTKHHTRPEGRGAPLQFVDRCCPPPRQSTEVNV